MVECKECGRQLYAKPTYQFHYTNKVCEGEFFVVSETVEEEPVVVTGGPAEVVVGPEVETKIILVGALGIPMRVPKEKPTKEPEVKVDE